ncbi:Proteinkinasesubdomain-containingproteinPKL ccin9 [Mycena sanguinolenta]|uniref:Proteinkinasesubdomain-containingproteinPKL ccin9 n=1 Tax=Mycena sanguinolenta TaxID=230812 RepID=A0A8H6YZG5_9AGAR|nr:Proteinkinasesubdomain-containingproteinPKL ccin9 [Mycena sanguinolenta]
MTILHVVESAEPDAESVTVTLETHHKLDDLKRLILVKWGKAAAGLDLRDLRLWKPKCDISMAHGVWAKEFQDSGCNLPEVADRLDATNIGLLGSQAVAAPLDATADIGLLGSPTAEKPPVVGVIVQVLRHESPHRTERLEEEARDTISDMTARYQNLVLHARGGKSPSQSAKSVNYRMEQRGPNPLCDGRYDDANPAATIAPPVQLYHPVFARFIDDVNNTALEIPGEVLVATADLMHKASGIYEDEETRKGKIRPALKKALSFDITNLVNDDRTYPDSGVMWTISETEGPLNHTVALAIEDEKRELGGGRYWVQPANDDLRALCCCPTFLIAFAGPWISVLGAVFTDKCIPQRLTDFIWMGNGSVFNSHASRRVARVLYSLTRSLHELRKYYTTLSRAGNSTRFFPSPKAFQPPDSTPVRFEYVEALQRDASCVTFLCKTEKDNQSIVVKFAESYCYEAHTHLAAKGMAPQLLYCGPIDLSPGAPSYGGLEMIVMEYLEGKMVAQVEQHNLPRDFAVQLKNIIDVLHNGGFVFGDLRPPNIMVSKDKVKLIDFDWAGRIGIAQYPLHLSSRIVWPEGVRPMGKIEKAHDLAMLQALINPV